jgi:two-component system sensor histidine kinase AlgZ
VWCAAPGSGARGYFTRDLPIEAGWCAAIALILTVILATGRGLSLRGWLLGFSYNLAYSLAIGVSISGLYRFVHPRMLPRLRGRLGAAAAHALVLVSGVAIGAEISTRLVDLLGGPPATMTRGNVLRIGLVIAIVSTLLLLAFERVELTAEQARKEALRARLEALQARTNPHFLFNSLNTVAGLIEDQPKTAERILEKLAHLFRYSLDGSQASWVRLEQELAAVESYLEVEKIRLGDRLRVETAVDADTGSILVPPLILQSLVENAVLHAVAPRREGGRLVVRAVRDGSTVQISVADDGPGLGLSPHRGSGSSLSDLRRRLEIAYGGRARVEIGSRPGDGTRVTLTLPAEAPG